MGRIHQLVLPAPHSNLQAALFAPPERFEGAEQRIQFYVAACGTKFGKTVGAGSWLVSEAWENPGINCRWIAPVYAQARLGFGICSALIPKRFREANRSRLEITLANGTVIQFRSGEKAENLEGYACHRFVIDEAAKVPEQAWISHQTTLTATGGFGWIISTPKGRNWFWEVYQRGLDVEFPRYACWRFPSMANPRVDLAHVEDARRTLPDRVFAQYYLALFLDDLGGVFRRPELNVRGTLERYRAGHRYVVGVDLAKHRDWTVSVVMDLDRRHVVAMDRFQRISWPQAKERVLNLANAYGRAEIILDATGIGDPIYDDLKARGVRVSPYKFTPASKAALVDNLTVEIEQGRISYPQIPQLLAELKSYEWKIAKNGRATSTGAPTGFHDDCVMALALASWRARGFAAVAPVEVVVDSRTHQRDVRARVRSSLRRRGPRSLEERILEELGEDPEGFELPLAA